MGDLKQELSSPKSITMMIFEFTFYTNAVFKFMIEQVLAVRHKQ